MIPNSATDVERWLATTMGFSLVKITSQPNIIGALRSIDAIISFILIFLFEIFLTEKAVNENKDIVIIKTKNLWKCS